MLNYISRRNRLSISLIVRKNINKHVSMKISTFKFPTYKIKENSDGVTCKIVIGFKLQSVHLLLGSLKHHDLETLRKLLL